MITISYHPYCLYPYYFGGKNKEKKGMDRRQEEEGKELFLQLQWSANGRPSLASHWSQCSSCNHVSDQNWPSKEKATKGKEEKICQDLRYTGLSPSCTLSFISSSSISTNDIIFIDLNSHNTMKQNLVINAFDYQIGGGKWQRMELKFKYDVHGSMEIISEFSTSNQRQGSYIFQLLQFYV